MNRQPARIPTGPHAGKLAKQAGGKAVREYLRICTQSERESLAECPLMNLPSATPGLFDAEPVPSFGGIW
jgi:hypothetical protein